MIRKWVWGIVALAAAMVLIAALIRQESTQTEEQTHAAQATASSSSAEESPDKSLPVTSQPNSAATGSVTETAAPADPEFQKWLAQEAKSLNHHNVDGVKKEAEIRKVVAKITPSQARQLLHTARNSTAPAGEKILATYLMVEGGLTTRNELLDFVNDEMAAAGEPHTHEEVNGVREKSLRIMAIDGLFSQAQKDPGARAALVSQIGSIQDPYIKAYAQRKLEELDRS